jgi:hypothetical protein
MTELFHGRNRVIVSTLLDTGAFRPIFGVQVAEKYLGINWRDLPLESILGVTGSIKCYKSKVKLRFGPIVRPIECEVYFAPGLKLNLLGRMGVFNHVQIGIDEAARKIYMALNIPASP